MPRDRVSEALAILTELEHCCVGSGAHAIGYRHAMREARAVLVALEAHPSDLVRERIARDGTATKVAAEVSCEVELENAWHEASLEDRAYDPAAHLSCNAGER